MAAARPRRGYLDWLRGIAVLIMIQAHVIDSWTAEPYRHAREFGRAFAFLMLCLSLAKDRLQ